MKYLKILLIMFSTVVFYGCKKEPGVGGNSAIKGRVWVKDYNSSFTNLIGEYPGEDEYVYIVYGEKSGYDKRIKSDYNGEFNFEFLYPGDYTIYVYSVDTTGIELDGQVAVVTKVNIENKKETIDIGDITIAK